MHKILVILLLLTAFPEVMGGERQRQPLNFDWKHSYGDITDAHLPGFDDSGWTRVNLPHDASIAGPFCRDSLNSDRKNGFLPRRKGWYRKHFELSGEIGKEMTFLEVEGVYRDARVYVNGIEKEHILNGYESRLINISDVVSPGDNLIAISYDNTDKESSRWYNGEGLYREINLLTVDPIHVAYEGTYVATPYVSDKRTDIEIQTEIINESDKESDVTVCSEVYDPLGQMIMSVTDVAPIRTGETYVFRQNGKIDNPELWSLDKPQLYKLVTTVKSGGERRDSYETSFGMRDIEFDREKGLLLNGEKVFLKGVNMHHDLGPLGAAAFHRGFERRLEGFKRLGCNAVRLSHNPHSHYVLEWCDRNGMLVFDEAFDKWDGQYFGKDNDFKDLWEESLTWFVKRDRNHPSVFIWSVGNEVTQQRKTKDNYGVEMMEEMRAHVHALDPGRKVTVALAPARRHGVTKNKSEFYRSGPPELEFHSDVVSVNYREEFWPLDRAKYPQLIFMLSEAQVGNLGGEWFNLDHEKSVGLFYWGGTDYIGESFGWPAKGWVNGIISITDEWKPFSYYIKSLFSDEPMVHIAVIDSSEETAKHWNDVDLRFQPMSSHWNWEGCDSVTVSTFSNCQEVELRLNGRCLGVKRIPSVYHTKEIKGYSAEEFDPDSPIETGPEIHKELEWTIPFEPGVLEAIGYIDGKEVTSHRIGTAGKAHQIKLEADRNTVSADGMDLVYVTASVVDENDILVPSATDEIEFSVSGAGEIIAVGSADMLSDEPYVGNRRKAFEGKALLVIRSTREPGKINIAAHSSRMKPAKLDIPTEL